jgi:hypothetical protein
MEYRVFMHGFCEMKIENLFSVTFLVLSTCMLLNNVVIHRSKLFSSVKIGKTFNF